MIGGPPPRIAALLRLSALPRPGSENSPQSNGGSISRSRDPSRRSAVIKAGLIAFHLDGLRRRDGISLPKPQTVSATVVIAAA